MEREIRTVSSLTANNKKLIGQPVIYNSRSENLGGFVEVIAPQAFSEHLATNPDIRALVEHDTKLILGRTKSNTLTITENHNGLSVVIEPPQTQSTRDLMVSVERGDITGMSFSFSVPDGGDDWDFEQTPALRTVNKAVLHEVTITSLPAYQATNIQVAQRALNQQGQNLKKWLDFYEVM